MKKIVLGVGFGNLKFGMTEEDVLDIAGAPDEIFPETGYSEDGYRALYYDEEGYSVSFDNECDNRLAEMSFEDEEFILDDKIMVGMSMVDVLNAATELGYGEQTEEDIDEEIDDEPVSAFSFEDKNVTFWFRNDTLDTIQIGPFFEDDDTIAWPE